MTHKEYDDFLKDIRGDLDPLYFLEDDESDREHNDRIMTTVTNVINKIIRFRKQHNLSNEEA